MSEQNNSLRTNNIFSNIKTWFYNLFHKSKTNEVESIEGNNNISNEENVKPKDYFAEYKEKSARRQYLLNLQRKYKNKEILEKDRIELENLYIEQNSELKREIRSFEAKINKQKNK